MFWELEVLAFSPRLNRHIAGLIEHKIPHHPDVVLWILLLRLLLFLAYRRRDISEVSHTVRSSFPNKRLKDSLNGSLRGLSSDSARSY